MRRAVLLGLAISIAAAAPAQADQVIAGRDTLDWDKPSVAIAPGETITWTFDGTQQAHNVQPAEGESWMQPSPIGVPAPPWSHRFDTEGVYNFLCQVHPTTMRGTVTVSAAPLAPVATPVPLSQQAYANDDASPVPLEKIELDKTQPRLAAVSVKRAARRAARVRFRVSEQSVVTIRFKRRARIVRTVETAASRLGAVTVRMRPGRYRVDVRAVDLAGNRSRLRVARVTVR